MPGIGCCRAERTEQVPALPEMEVMRAAVGFTAVLKVRYAQNWGGDHQQGNRRRYRAGPCAARS